RLVVDGQVVDDVRVALVLGPVHPLQAVLDDVPDLVPVGGVVVHHATVGGSQHRGVPVGVLQALTGQRGAAGGGADQEPAGELVAGGPELVAGALEPEHGVVEVERHHHLAMRGIGGAHG